MWRSFAVIGRGSSKITRWKKENITSRGVARNLFFFGGYISFWGWIKLLNSRSDVILPHKKLTWADFGGYKYRYPPPSLRPWSRAFYKTSRTTVPGGLKSDFLRFLFSFTRFLELWLSVDQLSATSWLDKRRVYFAQPRTQSKGKSLSGTSPTGLLGRVHPPRNCRLGSVDGDSRTYVSHHRWCMRASMREAPTQHAEKHQRTVHVRRRTHADLSSRQ